MALTPPNLDDRTFERLLDLAKQRAAQVCPEWTDWSPGSPGVTLLELFAFLTETMIYRLNRLPEKAYVEFLRLMGVRLQPPAAARVMLRFSRAHGAAGEGSDSPPVRIGIPLGTRVTMEQAEAGSGVVFTTAGEAVLEADRHHVDVPALHCDQIDGEKVGDGTGLPGQTVTVARSPIVAPTGEADDLVVGVQATLDEIGAGRSREFGGQVFRIWSAVEHFAGPHEDRYVYVVDRAAGTITFAPAIRTFSGTDDARRPETLAEVPGKDREIRVWYRTGGGAGGNLAAGTLTKLLDPIDGVQVHNPQAATGGCDAETVANALVRGPQQLHSQDRAVTARDFERIACSFGAVARARAAAQAELWAHAEPGTVEILLVPDVPPSERRQSRLAAEQLRTRQTADTTDQIAKNLDQCRSLGASVDIQWADYKVVRVKARIRSFHGENTDQIESQIRERLNQFISPLPTPAMPSGWPFDQQLPAGRLYDEIFRVPGVKEIEYLRLVVDDAPDQPIRSLAADAFQSSTWYAVSGNALYRSLDNAQSWQHLQFGFEMETDEQLDLVRSHAGRAGYVAATSRVPGETESSNIYYSDDCGRSWQLALRTAFSIHDLAWIQRNQQPTMLLAASAGLYELAVNTGELTQIVMAGMPADTGFWTIAVSIDPQGQPVNAAAAAKDDRGVWISYEAGRSKTFLPIGLEQEDVRTLVFQDAGSRSFLWAGTRVVGNRPGRGCFRWDGPVEKWHQVLQGWPGAAGSCLALAAHGPQLMAATYGGGVVWLDAARSQDITWQSPAADCGLPGGVEERRFLPIHALAAEPHSGVLLAGCNRGVYRSPDRGQSYEVVCKKQFIDSVPLPRQMLFCAGEHELEVLSED